MLEVCSSKTPSSGASATERVNAGCGEGLSEDEHIKVSGSPGSPVHSLSVNVTECETQFVKGFESNPGERESSESISAFVSG